MGLYEAYRYQGVIIMCKYCQIENHEKLETLHSTSLDNELKSGSVTLEITEE